MVLLGEVFAQFSFRHPHSTASGALMNRWQKLMLLASGHPLKSGETLGDNSAFIPTKYYFSMHSFNHEQEKFAFPLCLDNLSFGYSGGLYYPPVERKNSV